MNPPQDKLYTQDCIKFMQGLPDGYVQMIWADPPFNLNKKYETYRDSMKLGEYLEWTREWIEAAVPKLAADGTIFVYNIPKLLTYTAPILNEHLHFKHWIAWNENGKPLGKTLQPAHYGILYYGKSPRPKFRDVRAPHKTCRKCKAHHKDYGGKEYLRHPFGTLISDVWDDIHRVRHARKRINGHPCQLPVHLVERAILMTTDEHDVVYEPFVGGGSGAVAAKQMGRTYIGTDIDAGYIRASRQKFESADATTIGEAYASMHCDKIVSIQDNDMQSL